MNPEIKKITDRNIIYDYLKRLFPRKTVYLKTAQLNIETSSFIFNEKGVVFATPASITDETVRLYVRNGNELLVARAVITSRAGTEYGCSVTEILIMEIPRKEQRINIQEGKAYISNIISDFTLKINFEDNKRRILALKDDIEKKLGEKYHKVKIYAMSEQKIDARMTYFMNERKPYFIRNITEKSDDEQYRYYIKVIHPEDHEANRSMVSEIAVPFLYRYMMPFGYLRVTSPKPLGDEDYSYLKKQGMSISTFFTNDTSIIRSSEERVLITDLSMTGLGVLFRERVMLKHFREESLVIFTVFMPGNKTATVMCQVKNITIMKNSVYRVGCSIVNFDAIGEVNYSEYLDSLGISTAAPE